MFAIQPYQPAATVSAAKLVKKFEYLVTRNPRWLSGLEPILERARQHDQKLDAILTAATKHYRLEPLPPARPGWLAIGNVATPAPSGKLTATIRTLRTRHKTDKPQLSAPL